MTYQPHQSEDATLKTAQHMTDVFDQLEASERRDERERDLLLAFVQQIAAGEFTKGRAVIRAKSLLREVSYPGAKA